MELPNDLRDGLDVTRVLCISAYSLFICKVKRKIGTGKIDSYFFQRIIIFLSAIQRIIIFPKCEVSAHYFS